MCIDKKADARAYNHACMPLYHCRPTSPCKSTAVQHLCTLVYMNTTYAIRTDKGKLNKENKMLSIQEPRSEQLQLKQECYTQVPEKSKLVKIAKLYAKAFEGDPWNEYKVCQNGHFFGLQQAQLKLET